MAADGKTEAALALHRFGMGPRQSSLAALAADPRGALLAELDEPDVGRIVGRNLMASDVASRAAFGDNLERRARRILAERKAKAVKLADAGGGDNAMADDNAMAEAAAQAVPPDPTPPRARLIFLEEAEARFAVALNSEIGFVERLVWFWSNHFAVSGDDVPARIGAFEREAIRPHVLGRFADMLLAVEGHPAMLLYLNNASSMGPDSVAGIVNKRGINENLGREILELHTLGVRSGYTQQDVIHLASALTGWGVSAQNGNPDHGGEFAYNPRMHQPGEETILGTSYAQEGMEQARQALKDLARHPATATHVATKLARHFVADEPPEALVGRLAATFRETDGDLKAVARTLASAPEAWAAPRGKLKRPTEWMTGALRLAGVMAPDIRRLTGGLSLMGEPLWQPPGPNGFSDESAAWTDGLSHRLDVANVFAGRFADRVEPVDLVEAGLGPLASEETRQAVGRAESRAQALTLLLMSPEFQRR